MPAVILLAEDEPLIRLLAADTLVEVGFRVIEAGSAKEALTLLEARPDTRVLVTDVKMPGGMDGFELARIVSERWPHIGIIITSGHAIPQDGPMPKGGVFLPKPYMQHQLLEAVLGLVAEPLAAPRIVPAEAIIVGDAADKLLQPAESSRDARPPATELDGETED